MACVRKCTQSAPQVHNWGGAGGGGGGGGASRPGSPGEKPLRGGGQWTQCSGLSLAGWGPRGRISSGAAWKGLGGWPWGSCDGSGRGSAAAAGGDGGRRGAGGARFLENREAAGPGGGLAADGGRGRRGGAGDLCPDVQSGLGSWAPPAEHEGASRVESAKRHTHGPGPQSIVPDGHIPERRPGSPRSPVVWRTDLRAGRHSPRWSGSCVGSR